MAYLRKHGWYRLNLGDPKTRTPHGEGNFPTASGKCEFYSEGAAAGGDFVAPPFRQMYMAFQDGTKLDPLPGYVPARERPETNPSQAKRFPLNIVSPKSHGFPQLAICQRAAQDPVAGRAGNPHQPGGRAGPQHSGWRGGAGLQRSRHIPRQCESDGGRAGGRRGGLRSAIGMR